MSTHTYTIEAAANGKTHAVRNDRSFCGTMEAKSHTALRPIRGEFRRTATEITCQKCLKRLAKLAEMDVHFELEHAA